MLDTLVSQIANGLVLGFIYVLIAVGLSITFGLLGVINFAHGAFFALGAYVAWQLFQLFGWSAVILAPPLVGLIGMLVEVTIIRRLYGKEPLLSLIVTFALALLIEALIRYFWGADGKPFNPPPLLSGIVEAGPLLITKYRVAVLGDDHCNASGIVGVSHMDPLRSGSSRRQPRSGNGRTLGHQSAARPDRRVWPRLRAGCDRRRACRTTLDGVAVDGGQCGHASFRRGGDRRPRFISWAPLWPDLAVGVVTSLTIQFKPEAAAASMYILMFAIMLLRPRGLFGERWERFE